LENLPEQVRRYFVPWERSRSDHIVHAHLRIFDITSFHDSLFISLFDQTLILLPNNIVNVRIDGLVRHGREGIGHIMRHINMTDLRSVHSPLKHKLLLDGSFPPSARQVPILSSESWLYTGLIKEMLVEGLSQGIETMYGSLRVILTMDGAGAFFRKRKSFAVMPLERRVIMHPNLEKQLTQDLVHGPHGIITALGSDSSSWRIVRKRGAQNQSPYLVGHSPARNSSPTLGLFNKFTSFEKITHGEFLHPFISVGNLTLQASKQPVIRFMPSAGIVLIIYMWRRGRGQGWGESTSGTSRFPFIMHAHAHRTLRRPRQTMHTGVHDITTAITNTRVFYIITAFTGLSWAGPRSPSF